MEQRKLYGIKKSPLGRRKAKSLQRLLAQRGQWNRKQQTAMGKGQLGDLFINDRDE